MSKSVTLRPGGQEEVIAVRRMNRPERRGIGWRIAAAGAGIALYVSFAMAHHL